MVLVITIYQEDTSVGMNKEEGRDKDKEMMTEARILEANIRGCKR